MAYTSAPMVPSPRRILIVRLSAIGDVVRALPALEALRRAEPYAHIAWLVEKEARPMLEHHPMLDAVYVWDRRTARRALRRPWQWGRIIRQLIALGLELRHRPYDLALDFQSLLKSGLWTRASGATTRRGFARSYCRERANALFTNEKIDPGDHRLPRVDRNLALVANLLHGEAPSRFATWHNNAESEAWAEHTLQHYGSRAPIILHPGTSRRDKFWSPSGWAAVGDTLRQQTGAPILITWGPGERDDAQAIVEHMWGDATVAPETPSLTHLVSVIRRSKLFISVDNGPMHLAALAQTPVVGLFGPRDVHINQPTSPYMRCVCEQGIYAPGDAMPERGGEMQEIRVADVITAARDLLQE